MAHDHEIYMTLTDTAVEVRDAAALRKYASELARLAARDNHRLYLAIAYRARGVEQRLAGEHTEAETSLKQALGLFTKVGARWQIGRTLFEMGENHRIRSHEKAREYYSQALGAFEEMQALPYAEQTRVALNGLR